METDKRKKLFGNQASNYTIYRKPYIDEVHRLLFSLLPDGSKRILDVACGTGKSTEPLLKSNRLQVFGVDHDPLMIEEAQKQAKAKNLNITYSIGEAEHLPFEDGHFDAITVGTAFHWFVNDIALSEMKRVLKDNALLFIFWTLAATDVPEEDSIPQEISQSFNWKKVPSELRDLHHISDFLKKSGMKEVSIARVPCIHSYTVEERVGLMTTGTSYALLSEEDKKRYIEEATAALTTKLGDRPYFTYDEEIQVVHGFKTKE